MCISQANARLSYDVLTLAADLRERVGQLQLDQQVCACQVNAHPACGALPTTMCFANRHTQRLLSTQTCAMRCLTARTQMSRQAQEVVGLVGAAQGFRQVSSGQKGIAARRVVAQVVHSLSKLGDALGGILPSQVYVQAAGQVLQSVSHSIIGNMM